MRRVLGWLHYDWSTGVSCTNEADAGHPVTTDRL